MNLKGTNRHGLNRYIPEEVKEFVRKRDRFGCVICGDPVIEFDHVDPPFAEAQSHDKDAIASLCSNCHSRKDKGFISIDNIKKAMSNPANYNRNYINYRVLRGAHLYPRIILGRNEFVEVGSVIDLFGLFKIGFSKNRNFSDRFHIDMRVVDFDLRDILRIDKDEIVFKSDITDFVIKGNSISISDDRIIFELLFSLEFNGTISINKLFYRFGPINYLISDNKYLYFVNGYNVFVFDKFFVSKTLYGFVIDGEGWAFGRNGCVPYHAINGRVTQGNLRSFYFDIIEAMNLSPKAFLAMLRSSMRKAGIK